MNIRFVLMRLFITTAGEFMINHGRYFSYEIPITSSDYCNYMVKPNSNTVAVGLIQ